MLFRDTVLASSLALSYPLFNSALPSTTHSRDRLLARIFSYRLNEAAVNETRDEDFALLYAYALVTGQLSLEIHTVLEELEGLLGTLDLEVLKLQ